MVQKERGSRTPRVVDRVDVSAELAEWRATCRRQAAVIEALTNVVGRLRSGVTALKAENAQLRVGQSEFYERSLHVPDRRPAVQARVALGVHAPACARRALARALVNHVAPQVLEHAKLAISELVTNSVCHGDVRERYVTVRAFLTRDHLRLEVEDRGQVGQVALQPLSDESTVGFGLHIIQRLSERWGTERSAAGGTLVWAELPLRARADAMSHTAPEASSAPAAADEVHVVPVPRAGTWALYADSVALSEHATQTAAESAAHDEARRLGCERVVVHDRYHRTRDDSVDGPAQRRVP